MGRADVKCLAYGTAQHFLLFHLPLGALFPQSAPEW
jgi:hypothetical protein